uniref:Uncharacterized protein n=1 Tax=uncultured marine virus TaxID=186617 RepID=A0A0F7L930_9VIRU|nr:hypothetical protein [uncultured marine virus]
MVVLVRFSSKRIGLSESRQSLVWQATIHVAVYPLVPTGRIPWSRYLGPSWANKKEAVEPIIHGLFC